jgi:hypothetical protein
MKNTQTPPMILTDNSVTLIINNTPYTMRDSNASFLEVKNRIANEDFDGIETLFNTGAAVGVFTKGNIVVQDNAVLYKGEVVANHVVDRILDFMRQGLPYQPLVNFLDKLMLNPSRRAVQELYRFLEHGNLTICEDGDFLAYKNVRADYKDIYSGTFDNSIGAICEVSRNQVDEDSNRTCSHGLHFCSHEYLPHYSGGRTVIVKINPANVVTIPADYNDTKGRCCRYEVIADCEVQNQPTSWVTGAVVCSIKTLEEKRGGVSEATREKLRQAALRQRRDHNGRYI